MDKTKEWYRELRKPPFAPPSWIFAPVWTVLYAIIAGSFGFVAYKTYHGVLPLLVLLPFVLNLIFNFAFMPLQFRLRNMVLASADILLVLASLIVSLIAVYPYFPWVAFINIPYLLWVAFASVVQLTITCMNRDKWRVYYT